MTALQQHIRTHDCEPTLTDAQVLEFCRTGHLMLPEVVSDAANRRVLEWLDQHRDDHAPGETINDLLREPWFVDQVLRAPAAAGALRSLLGAEYAAPDWLSDFSIEGRAPANQWHIDGGSVFSHELTVVKWFYLPVACPIEAGPTEFVSGSHHVHNQVRFMAHYDGIRGTWKAAGPAGSIYLTAYQLWHRRAVAHVASRRVMLTSSAWRTGAPTWDWQHDAGFDLESADYGLSEPRFGEQNRSSVDAARMFCWLTGQGERFAKRPGPSWPFPPYDGEQPRFGKPDALANRA